MSSPFLPDIAPSVALVQARQRDIRLQPPGRDCRGGTLVPSSPAARRGLAATLANGVAAFFRSTDGLVGGREAVAALVAERPRHLKG